MSMSRGPTKIFSRIHGESLVGCFLAAEDMHELLDALAVSPIVKNLEIYGSRFSQTQLIHLVNFIQYCPLTRIVFSAIEVSDRFVAALDFALYSNGNLRVIFHCVDESILSKSDFYSSHRLLILSDSAPASRRPVFPTFQVPERLASFCSDLTPLHHLTKAARVDSVRHSIYEERTLSWTKLRGGHAEEIQRLLSNIFVEIAKDMHRAEEQIENLRLLTEENEDDLSFKDYHYVSPVPQKYLELFALKTQMVMRVTERDELLKLLAQF